MSPWLTLLVGVIGGGAAGAVINNLWINRRSRRQPVGYTKEVIEIFRKDKDFANLNARLVIEEHRFANAQETSVENLALARITITNKGNQDINEYSFGVTLGGTNRALDWRTTEPDRHHSIQSMIPRDEKVSALDFTLEPFNRGDKYGVDIYFTYEDLPGTVELSSSHSTVLTKTTNLASEPQVPLVDWFRLVQYLFSIVMTLMVLLVLLSLRMELREILKRFLAGPK